MLTKSLHTVTAVAKVAMYIKANLDAGSMPVALTYMALGVLGYTDISMSDPTYIACLKAVTKAMQS